MLSDTQFDEDQAIDAAMYLFWEKGFQLTSITDLATSMGVSSVTMHNIWGGKNEVFIKSLLRFLETRMNVIFKNFQDVEDPLESIGSMFDCLTRQTSTDSKDRGCFLINTVMELPKHSEAVKMIVTGAMHQVETFFQEKIVIGQQKGCVVSNIDPNEAAKFFVSQVIGLRLLSPGLYDNASCEAIKRQAVRGIAA